MAEKAKIKTERLLRFLFAVAARYGFRSDFIQNIDTAPFLYKIRQTDDYVRLSIFCSSKQKINADIEIIGDFTDCFQIGSSFARFVFCDGCRMDVQGLRQLILLYVVGLTQFFESFADIHNGIMPFVLFFIKILAFRHFMEHFEKSGKMHGA